MKNGDGPTVLVRTDMDALPVEEETGLPYASKVVAKNDEGKDVHVMHACGHDAHIAAFIGTARALAKVKRSMARHDRRSSRNQQRRLVPAHARCSRTDSMTDSENRILRLVFMTKPTLQAGHIAVTEGYTSANVDSVDVTVRGVGGHGAYPHKTKDPIVLAAEIINAWQTIVSRENNPLDPIVITVGSIHGGTKHNIIPDEVKMQITVRTYKSEVRERVLAAYRSDCKRLRGSCWNTAGTALRLSACPKI